MLGRSKFYSNQLVCDVSGAFALKNCINKSVPNFNFSLKINTSPCFFRHKLHFLNYIGFLNALECYGIPNIALITYFAMITLHLICI